MNDRMIGLKVARLRKERDWSTTELAHNAGLSQPQISRLENGKQGFRSATLDRIAKALEVPTAYFFDDQQPKLKNIREEKTNQRQGTGKQFADDLLLQYGDLVLTPGYRQVIRKLSQAMKKSDCDVRTLRRLVGMIAGMDNSERSRLLDNLQNKGRNSGK